MNLNFKDIDRQRWDRVFATCIHCGGRKAWQASNLKKAKSCGCKGPTFAHLKALATKHGETSREKKVGPEYRAWAAMRSRCYCTTHKSYPDYGGRGITVDERWHDYATFRADMGLRPSGTSLGRRDNDKGYSKENCRWETRTEQQRNTRKNKYFEVRGVSGTLREIADKLGAEYQLLYTRHVRFGWPIERALTEPKHPTRPHKYG